MADQVRNVEEINTRLADLSAQILPPGLLLSYVRVELLREQEINAHSMPKRMFDQLVENVKSVGTLESIPLCVKQDGGIAIISGHHRIRAARAAGVTHILVLLYESLPTSRTKAKQLAHNSITGIDDPDLVRRIWEQIGDVKAQFESFIDPKMFDAIPAPVSFQPMDVNLDKRAKTILLIFLPIQHQDFDAALEAILPATQIDAVYLANKDAYEGWREAVKRARDECEISAVPTAVAEMARLAMQRLDQLKEESPEVAAQVGAQGQAEMGGNQTN